MPENKIIKGIRETGQVFIDGVELLPAESLKLKNHSPSGFAWGYGGSGPAQLALAILLHFTTKEIALSFYQSFKWTVISALPSGDFELPVEGVKNWLECNVEANLKVFCDADCFYLKPKEHEQTEQKEPHMCLKHDKRVLHRHHHPKLLKLPECFITNDVEASGGIDIA